MLLSLAGVLLCCGALCFTLPLPPATGTGCPSSSLILETLSDVQTLISKGSSEILPLNNVMEAGGTVTTYLEEFIEALKSSRARLEERLIAQKLKKIQDAGKSCLGWLEQDWEPVEEEDFLSNLEYLLRFLNHYVLSDETKYFFKEV